jgi:alkylhydroperoxidase/carboxymuconolactone decarboxylase family protein YurZ
MPGRCRTMSSVEEAFRRLTIGEPDFVAAVADRDRAVRQVPRLDARTEALMRIAALVAVDAPPSAYRSAVAAALIAGARLEDLFAVLVAVADDVGSARIISAAPRIALAAGYDVEAALE